MMREDGDLHHDDDDVNDVVISSGRFYVVKQNFCFDD
jgi:hypothetical protein